MGAYSSFTDRPGAVRQPFALALGLRPHLLATLHGLPMGSLTPLE